MFNKIIIIGNLTRDVEKRYLPSGTAMSTFAIASTHRFSKQDGTKADETCFVDVKIFGRTAEVAEQYLHKGSRVLIEGRLVFESWTDQSGNKRSKHSILAESMKMLDRKQDSQGGQGGGEYGEQGGHSGYGSGGYGGNSGASYGSSGGSYGSGYDSSYNAAPSKPYQSQSSQAMHNPQHNQGGYEQNIPSIDINDDEIPF